MQSTMELMMAEFQHSIKGKETVLEKSVKPFVDLTQNAMGNGEQNSVSNSIMGNMIQKKIHPHFDFPVFNGSDIKNWVMKCEYFFQFHPLNHDLLKLSVALNLEGEARSCFLAYFKSNPNVSWKQFVVDIKTRFGETLYNRLQHTTTVSHY